MARLILVLDNEDIARVAARLDLTDSENRAVLKRLMGITTNSGPAYDKWEAICQAAIALDRLVTIK